ncbi:TonB-dependent siderophore receptor [Sphingorhabdus sp.]|uniref:TonB-dependent siderophore receptor n=1 Tax=Sphingorhabdus sp. TaxID=1902408 RepID=UPI0035943D55
MNFSPRVPKLLTDYRLGAGLVALATATALGSAQPAWAQDAVAADDNARADGEIVVTGRYTIDNRIDTATGLGLTLRETPQSVTVITAQRILDQNLDTVADVVVNSVGVSVNEVDDVRNTFNARGFEIQNYQVDGVPLAWTLAGGAGETVADVSIYERVEIVRGATGLLTGAGDPSASINLVRKHAVSTDWTGYVNAGYGSWNTWQASGDIGGTLTSDGSIRVRAVAKYEQGESYIDRYKDKKLVLYGVIDADLTENTSFRAGISHQRETPTGPQWGALASFFTDGSFTNFPRSTSTSADWSYWDTTNQNIFANISHEFGNGWKLSANYNWLRNAQQTQILYLFGLLDKTTGQGLFSFPYSDSGESVQNSFDVQLKGDVGLFGRSHEFVLGALHSVQDRQNTTFGALAFPSTGNFFNWDGATFANPGFSTTGTLAVDEKTKQTGFYGAARINVADPLKLIVGGRLSSWKLDGFNFGPPRQYGDDNVFIPYVGALYDLTSNHRLYASYTKIFQPQNARDRNGDFLPPLDGKAYEIGIKSAFFNEALQTSLAYFRIEQDNLAQIDVGFFIPGVTPPTNASIAAQGTTSKGFEAEVTGQPAKGWNLSLGYSQFTADDADGNAVNTDHPRKLLKLFTTYRLLGALNGLTIGGGVNWRSKNFSEGTNPVTNAAFRFQQDAYALVSLLARYELNENLQLQVNVENLFDETYFSQIGFFSQYRYGSPRNFSASVNYRF